MRRLIKYAFEKGYNAYVGKYKAISTVEDMLNDFGSKEISMILLEAEVAEINLETLVQYANEVVQELKAEEENKLRTPQTPVSKEVQAA